MFLRVRPLALGALVALVAALIVAGAISLADAVQSKGTSRRVLHDDRLSTMDITASPQSQTAKQTLPSAEKTSAR